MLSSEQLKTYLNQYVYLGNKYNLYGVCAFFILARVTGGFTGTSASYPNFKACVLMIVVCVAAKLMMKQYLNLQDVCECGKTKTKAYVKPKQCPQEKSLGNVVVDAKSFLQETGVNTVFQYNLIAALMFVILGFMFRLFNITSQCLNPFLLVGLVFCLLGTKAIVNTFFVLQEWCPCDCYHKRHHHVHQCRVKPETDTNQDQISTIREPATDTNQKFEQDDSFKKINEEIDAQLSLMSSKQNVSAQTPIDTSDPAMQALHRQIATAVMNANTVPGEQSPNVDPDKINTLCNVMANKLKQYNTVDKCVNDIMSNASLKQMVEQFLHDDGGYACLKGCGNEAQLVGCVRDYLIRHPEAILKIGDTLDNISNPAMGAPTQAAFPAQATTTELCKIMTDKLKVYASYEDCQKDADNLPVQIKTKLNAAISDGPTNACALAAANQDAMKKCFADWNADHGLSFPDQHYSFTAPITPLVPEVRPAPLELPSAATSPTIPPVLPVSPLPHIS